HRLPVGRERAGYGSTLLQNPQRSIELSHRYLVDVRWNGVGYWDVYERDGKRMANADVFVAGQHPSQYHVRCLRPLPERRIPLRPQLLQLASHLLPADGPG